jgi:HNH endonuclease
MKPNKQKEDALSHQRLLEALTYDALTGQFTWNIDTRKLKAGAIAGSKRDYPTIQIDGLTYLAHRLAWFYVHGVWPTNRIDHVDCDSQNNRFTNLREATVAQNNRNRIGKTQHKGISYSKRFDTWRASIGFNMKNYSLGPFNSLEAAQNALDAKRLELHGDFARS